MHDCRQCQNAGMCQQMRSTQAPTESSITAVALQWVIARQGCETSDGARLGHLVGAFLSALPLAVLLARATQPSGWVCLGVCFVSVGSSSFLAPPLPAPNLSYPPLLFARATRAPWTRSTAPSFSSAPSLQCQSADPACDACSSVRRSTRSGGAEPAIHGVVLVSLVPSPRA
jgi:hypothetical protein